METAEESKTSHWQEWIAGITLLAIVIHVALKWGLHTSPWVQKVPLFAVYLVGGVPLVAQLLVKFWRREFGSDLLAGMSIVTAWLLQEYLAGAFVILMLSGGEALEAYAVRQASSVLKALAKRMPAIAHRQHGEQIENVSVESVAVGDQVVVFPHEICPVDGTVVVGHGVMDESYLTGEPYLISKTPGSSVLSGAINGEVALTIQADRVAADSRYAKIMQVMRESEQHRPRLRRLGDQLGAYYTPLAVGIGLVAWALSGQAVRFLAVLVVATPCPLLIAIPVAIIGAISLSAKRSIIIRDPSALENIDCCRIVIFDKTGTLTYGKPTLTEQLVQPPFSPPEVLSLAASVERYSKHPLSVAILQAANQAGIELHLTEEINERPGQGLRGIVQGRVVRLLSRKQLLAELPDTAPLLPDVVGGLECVVMVDGRFAATYRFRDTPRSESRLFVKHLGPKHQIERLMLVSGDRESAVRQLADEVGIREVYFNQSPEEKLEIVRKAVAEAPTAFVGDGINDAPALMAATVGVAFGPQSDVTTQAAGVVIMDSSLEKVDEFMHIAHRLKSIALQSALGGMSLSIIAMLVASFGYLPPVAGALTQELIDIVSVLNALRVSFPPADLTDYT